MPASIENRISQELSATVQQVVAAVRLLDEGATVPFISRYRKEATGNLDEATADDVLALTRDLVAQTGCGLLMVTHSARLAATLDRHINLSAGLIA